MNTSIAAIDSRIVDNLLPFMRDITRCEQSLRELSLMWHMIEGSAKINCLFEAAAILPTMATARNGLMQLEKDLVAGLVNENIVNVLEEIGTQARYVIDIVVRNLYERTADVGFLATDKELCAFVAGITSDAEAIRSRLRSYRNKYTVYDEILLLDTQGRVLAQINQTPALDCSSDPLIEATLVADGFVETFRASDLRPAKRQALIYSRRILHPETGAPIGVLCLCFNFEEEMEGIFRSHRDEHARSNMLLIDAQNRIIATADPVWMPVGTTVPINLEATPKLMIYGGREYFVRTCSASGYQGYMGPLGWRGQVMMPVDLAFRGRRQHALDEVPSEIVEGMLAHAQSFCQPLYEIMNAADTIRRVVWNGQVITAGQQGNMLKLRTVLDQISETGARSNEVFTNAIGGMYATVLSTYLQDVAFVAHLLVDLLDRNLYERSDDCRWWALASELGPVLAAQHPDEAGRQQVAAFLNYINRLYTVYTRLVVYDRQGLIVADSLRDGGESAVGSHIDPATLKAVLALRNEQQYHVTSFGSEPLYEGRPTYVYHAAVRMPGREGEIVGGIGIVFDSEVELAHMLAGAISGRASMSAAFVDRRGWIIASTDAKRPAGTRLDVDTAMLSLKNGNCASRVVIHDGQYAVMGCSVSPGYREFKTSDNYRDDVLAVVFQTFGKVHEHPVRINRVGNTIHDATVSDAAQYASFYSNGMLFALPAERVSEARSASEISRVSMGSRNERIGMISLNVQGKEGNYAWVFDLALMLSGIPSPVGSGSQVIVLRHEDKEIGLLVDDLHDVPKFGPAQFKPLPFAAAEYGPLVRQIIRANEGRVLLQVLDVPQLFACVNDPGLPTVLPLDERG